MSASPETRLTQLLTSRQATVGIVGMGYVGLPAAHAMHEAGFGVIGFDIDEEKIRKLEAGESYLKHLGVGLVSGLASSSRFVPTSDPRALADADAILLCVPTPLGRFRDPDLSYVTDSTTMVASVLRPGQLISLESTTYPGTTRDVCLPLLEAGGLKCGTDFFLVFSPEREDPGRQGVTTRDIPRLVGGIDEPSARLGHLLYSCAVDSVIRVDSAEIAESAKLLENIYRAVNIALVNELKPVLDVMGIDIWKVVEAAATKPFGFQPFYPGPGLGGHCIPIDPFYLSWKARAVGEVTRFIELAGEINSRMPEYVVHRIADALNEDGKAIRGSEVLVLGLAYKPNVDDVRETPAAEVIRLLLEREARVSYHDPHVASFPSMRKYRFQMSSVELTPEVLRGTDCAVVVTDHDTIDWQAVADCAALVVDTRNAMARTTPSRARIVKA